MRLPSWEELHEKEKNWEKQIHQKLSEKVSDTVKDHPILDSVFGGSLSLLPPPFGAIAQNIYNKAKQSGNDPLDGVLKYFEKLKDQGQEHYEIIANRLDSTLIGIQDLKDIANEISKIQEILIAEVRGIDKKIEEIKYLLNENYAEIMKPRWEEEKMAFTLGECLMTNVMSSYSYKTKTLTEKQFYKICAGLGIQDSSFDVEERSMINMMFDRSLRTELKHQFLPFINDTMDLAIGRHLGNAYNIGANFALLRDTINLGQKHISLSIATHYRNFLKRKNGLNKGGVVYNALECILLRLNPYKEGERKIEDPQALLEEVYKCVELIASEANSDS